jgi:hypothetical protein
MNNFRHRLSTIKKLFYCLSDLDTSVEGTKTQSKYNMELITTVNASKYRPFVSIKYLRQAFKILTMKNLVEMPVSQQPFKQQENPDLESSYFAIFSDFKIYFQ